MWVSLIVVGLLVVAILAVLAVGRGLPVEHRRALRRAACGGRRSLTACHRGPPRPRSDRAHDDRAYGVVFTIAQHQGSVSVMAATKGTPASLRLSFDYHYADTRRVGACSRMTHARQAF